MIKKFFFAAIIAASVWTVGAAVSGSVNVAEVSETTDVMATYTYEGTASVSMMNDSLVSGDYPGTFEINDVTGAINGSFNIYDSESGALIHTFSIVGVINFTTGLGSGSGSIGLPNGNSLAFTAVFSNATIVSGNSVTFTCTGTVTSTGKQSIFTFTAP
jgi:hypothetical protein